mmetsp:Transcript_8717/g.17033  ORF Transcript_8717/g.17033 Transcript_8717/m.17033 type:complete len:108 (+) Transcript_8717:149-472(+)
MRFFVEISVLKRGRSPMQVFYRSKNLQGSLDESSPSKLPHFPIFFPSLSRLPFGTPPLPRARARRGLALLPFPTVYAHSSTVCVFPFVHKGMTWPNVASGGTETNEK